MPFIFISSVYLLFFSKEKCVYLKISIRRRRDQIQAFVLFDFFYRSHAFNVVGKWVLCATTELHAIVFFQKLELTPLPQQTHSGASHRVNLKSTPCGQFYFNSRSPASPPGLWPDQGFGCRCYSKGRPERVITVVSGVALPHMLEPTIMRRLPIGCFNSTIMKTRKQLQSYSEITCSDWQKYLNNVVLCVCHFLRASPPHGWSHSLSHSTLLNKSWDDDKKRQGEWPIVNFQIVVWSWSHSSEGPSEMKRIRQQGEGRPRELGWGADMWYVSIQLSLAIKTTSL